MHGGKRILKHGWFEIYGVQTGEHKLKGRLRALTPLVRFAKGASILDIGCAEGMIGAWLLEQGPANLLHGIERHLPYLETAREVHEFNPRIKLFRADVEDFEAWLKEGHLLPSYDIVLCTCLAHKLSKPREFMTMAAKLCHGYFALHLPKPFINDVRSKHVVLDPDRVFEPLGFEVMLHDVDEVLSRKIYKRIK